jgi:hypothetical protein
MCNGYMQGSLLLQFLSLDGQERDESNDMALPDWAPRPAISVQIWTVI